MPIPTDPRRSVKSQSAFRTISEVSEDLNVPQHVLRFWETKFVQIRPMKRGGGRRYYRPEDVALLQRIRALLYTDGFTIKGVQKLLREGGISVENPAVEVPAYSAEILELAMLDDHSDDTFDEAELVDEGDAVAPLAPVATVVLDQAPVDLFASLSALTKAEGLTPAQRGVISEVADELLAIRNLLQVA